MIFVDDVDDRPVVAGTPGVGGSAPASIEEFPGRDPALMAFARCDVPLPRTSAVGERTSDAECSGSSTNAAD